MYVLLHMLPEMELALVNLANVTHISDHRLTPEHRPVTRIHFQDGRYLDVDEALSQISALILKANGR